MLPIGSRRRRLLYQSTPPSGGDSTASLLRPRPRPRVTPGFNKPVLLDAVRPTGQCIVIAIPNTADRGFDASLEEALCVPNRNVLAAPVAEVNEAALHRTAVVQRLLKSIEDEIRMRRPRHPPADDAAGED